MSVIQDRKYLLSAIAQASRKGIRSGTSSEDSYIAQLERENAALEDRFRELLDENLKLRRDQAAVAQVRRKR